MRFIRIGFAPVLVALAIAAVASAASGSAVVKLEKTKTLGKVLANAQGRTLYMWRADKGKTSSCYGQCTSFWPPLLTKGNPVAGAGIKASLLGTSKRKDGKLQVTYAGRPLYTYAGDSGVGQTNGEGSNGFGAKWYALAPSGAVIDKD